MTKLENTFVSYPDRGKWGSGAWEGNTSGHLILDLIDTYQPVSVFDPMEGSGTTADVCRDRGITYIGGDLKKGFDVLNPKNQLEMSKHIWSETNDRGADMIFLHPPYWAMIRYSNMNNDLSNGPYSLWLSRMEQIIRWCSRQLSPQGFIALLLADFRYNDRTYFLTDDTTSMGQMFQAGLEKEIRYIKVQHKTNSRGVVNIPGNVRFVHEYVTILRRRGAFV